MCFPIDGRVSRASSRGRKEAIIISQTEVFRSIALLIIGWLEKGECFNLGMAEASPLPHKEWEA